MDRLEGTLPEKPDEKAPSEKKGMAAGSAGRRAIKLREWFGLFFSAFILIGGILWPPLGFAAPLLILIAIVSNVRSKRWFCAKACPRAAFLSGFMSKFSRYRPTPDQLKSDSARTFLCGALVFCALGQTFKLWRNPVELASFFWLVCLLSFAVAAILAVAYKPRTWCALCPLGTLQDKMRKKTGAKK